MSEKQTTETATELSPELLEDAYALIDEPNASAFFALIEPYYGRAHEIPLSVFVKLDRCGANLDLLERLADAIVVASGPGGRMENRSAHFDMLELQLVLRTMKQVRVRLEGCNAPGGVS